MGLDLGFLPSVIALPLAGYRREPDPLLRLWAMCDSVEMTLRLVVALGLGDWQRHGGLPDGLRRELAPRIQQPTLGKWRGMALALAKHQPEGSLFPQLAPFVVDALEPFMVGDGPEPQQSLTALRNRLAHGGGMTRALAERMLTAHAPRFDQLASALTWLTEVKLVAPTHRGALLGPRTAVSRVDDDVLERARAAQSAAAGVVALAGTGCADLWPLVQYGTAGREPVPQIYCARGGVGLSLTPIGSDELAEVSAGPDVAAAFLARLEPPVAAPKRVHAGFESELAREADRRVGRSLELAQLVELAATARGMSWVVGAAGAGKSLLMASLVSELSDGQRLLLSYRFSANDERCSRAAFIGYACERLREHLTESPPAEGPPEQQLLAAVERAGDQVLFVLDGVDVIASADATFLPSVVTPLAGAAACICFSRPIAGVAADLELAPMADGDVRAMLVDKLGPLKRKLLARDEERDEQVVNPFIDEVVKRACGLPLYVTYVIGDVLSGRVRDFDALALPPTVADYHRRLLSGHGVSSLHQLLTPSLVALALARAAWSRAMLHAHLVDRALVTDDDAGRALVTDTLVTLAASLSSDDAAVAPRYRLFHPSLREHVLTAPELANAVEVARAALAVGAARAASSPPSPLRDYLLRHGIRHLRDAGRLRDAQGLLTDFEYLDTRWRALGAVDTPNLLVDLGCLESGDPWRRLIAARAHVLERADDNGVLQLAIAHAESSPITRAAERSLLSTRAVGHWLRLLNRPKEPPIEACLATHEGHEAAVMGVCALGAERAVSCGADGSLRLWDLAAGHALEVMRDQSDALATAMTTEVPRATAFRTLRGHRWTIWSVAVCNEDATVVVAAHGDGSLRLWDLATRRPRSVLHGHEGFVWRVAVGAEGIYSGGDDGTLRRWREDGTSVILHRSAEPITALACHGTKLVAGHERGVVTLDTAAVRADGQPVAAQEHLEPGVVAVACHDDAVWAGTRGGEIVTWTTAQRSRWQAHVGAVLSLAVSPTGLLSGGEDAQLKLWHTADGRLLNSFHGHAGAIWSVAPRGAAQALSASADGAVKRWDLSVPAARGGRAVHPGGARALAANGSLCVCVGGRLLTVWALPTGKRRRSVEANAALVAVCLIDEARAVAVDELGVAHVSDLERGVWVGSFAGVPAVTVSSGRGAIALGGRDGTVSLWDVTAKTRRWQVAAHDDTAIETTLGPDGSVASAGRDGTLAVIAPDGSVRQRLRGPPLVAASWDLAGGRAFTAPRAGGLVRWNLATAAPAWLREREQYHLLATLSAGIAVGRETTLAVATNDGRAIASWGTAGRLAAVAAAADRIIAVDSRGELAVLQLCSGRAREDRDADAATMPRFARYEADDRD